MENLRIRYAGATMVVVTSVIYGVFRIGMLRESYSTVHLISLICEISALALISTESVLLATRTKSKPRKQDERVLIESAKKVLYKNHDTSITAEQSAKDLMVKTDSQTQVTENYSSEPVDVCVFAEDATYDELRRCFLSLTQVKDTENVYVITRDSQDQISELISEFNYTKLSSSVELNATTKNVLVCRGKDVIYPDANDIARTYEFDGSTFLELRSVFSNENALGDNGLVEINDKRQNVREALATRGLSTWSTGPAIVLWDKASKADSSTAESLFRHLEQAGIHGQITQEIVSEEISHEPTIAEVDWRATDFKYTARALRNTYKSHRAIGSLIKIWSALVSLSFIRRVAAISLAMIFILDPARFDFVTSSYLFAGISIITSVLVGSYLIGDRRSIVSRIREFYFDIESVIYNVYKEILPGDTRGTESSIVRKLPSVSFLLIVADIVLVYRVVRQYNEATETLVNNLLKNASLFTGYLLVVSMLVGLGMVVIRQSRSAMRREISRGANLNSEPVSMVDLSPGGAGCISVMKFNEGDTLKFESSFPIGEENRKFHCDAVVKSCVEWGDSYRIGLEFTNLDRSQLDTLETYCSIIYPHSQARENNVTESSNQSKAKVNTRAEKRFISYAASFITLAAIIFSNITTWG